MEEIEIIKTELEALKSDVLSMEALLKTVLGTDDVVDYLKNQKKPAIEMRLSRLKDEKVRVLDSSLSETTKSSLSSLIQSYIEQVEDELEQVCTLLTEYGVDLQ
ncbi:MAG: hypothetical protein ACXQS2_04585 [Methermicoccaceae archaeon]